MNLVKNECIYIKQEAPEEEEKMTICNSGFKVKEEPNDGLKNDEIALENGHIIDVRSIKEEIKAENVEEAICKTEHELKREVEDCQLINTEIKAEIKNEEKEEDIIFFYPKTEVPADTVKNEEDDGNVNVKKEEVREEDYDNDEEYRIMEDDAEKQYIYTPTMKYQSRAPTIRTRNIKFFNCDVCHYSATKKSVMERHKRIHTGFKPYACGICPYSTSDKSSLDKHLRIHTKEKPFTCTICSYSATVKSALNSHMRVHTGEKPYTCKICPYSATQKSHIYTHMRIHTGEKPYACKMCSYSATIKSTLMKHMKIHTGEKPFTCSLCPYSAALKHNLDRHMKKHTGEN